jgi:hypothetical protein
MSGKSHCGLERRGDQNALVARFIHLLLKSGRCFIQVTRAQFFVWRTQPVKMSNSSEIAATNDSISHRKRPRNNGSNLCRPKSSPPAGGVTS